MSAFSVSQMAWDNALPEDVRYRGYRRSELWRVMEQLGLDDEDDAADWLDEGRELEEGLRAEHREGVPAEEPEFEEVET